MKSSIALFLPVFLSFTGCANESDSAADPMEEMPEMADAPAPMQVRVVAELHPTEGNETGGMVHFSSSDGRVQLTGTITGLEPGEHGFHIHETGDCSAPDGSSAGGHFNPHDDPHGSPEDVENAHHVGDLGNLTANEQGEAEVNIEDHEIALSGPESIVGKALVVHANQDDFVSQPSGNSGDRVGCGEIIESASAGPL